MDKDYLKLLLSQLVQSVDEKIDNILEKVNTLNGEGHSLELNDISLDLESLKCALKIEVSTVYTNLLSLLEENKQENTTEEVKILREENAKANAIMRIQSSVLNICKHISSTMSSE